MGEMTCFSYWVSIAYRKQGRGDTGYREEKGEMWPRGGAPKRPSTQYPERERQTSPVPSFSLAWGVSAVNLETQNYQSCIYKTSKFRWTPRCRIIACSILVKFNYCGRSQAFAGCQEKADMPGLGRQSQEPVFEPKK